MSRPAIENTDPNNAALSIILAAADNLKDSLVNYDTCVMRRSEVLTSIEKIMCYYKDLYNRRLNERKQSLITRFIRPPADSEPEEEPEEDPDDLDSMFNESQPHVADFEGFLEEVEALHTESPPSDDGEETQ